MFKRTQGVRSVCRGGQSIPKSNSMGGKKSNDRSIRKNKIAINNLI